MDDEELWLNATMGYDPVGNAYGQQPPATEPPQPGHFYCQYISPSYTTYKYIVRVWDDDGEFGESTVYSQAFVNDPAVYQNILPDLVAIFPKLSPAIPPATGEATQGVAPSTRPKITLRCSSRLGARKYVFKLYKGTSSSGTPRGDATVWHDPTYHRAAPEDSATKDKSAEFTLNMNDQKSFFFYQVKAENSFGSSAWAEGIVWVPENRDPTIPVAVTDLRADYDGSSITLTWKPPFDRNTDGIIAAVAEYDIRVSREAIVDIPIEPFSTASTNPEQISNWESAVAITEFPDFQPAPTIPAPVSFDDQNVLEQSVSITGSLFGNYYFAIKSKDASGNVSYISNLAGVTIGGVGGPISFTLRKVGDIGLNAFANIFEPPVTVTVDGNPSTGVSTIADFVAAIHSVKPGIVTAIGWLKNGRIVGYYVSGNNFTATQGADIAAEGREPLVAGQSYQITVTDTDGVQVVISK